MKLKLILMLACASQASAFTLSLDDIPVRVRSSHPQLKAARLAIGEARARQLAAGRLENPTLGLEFTGESRVSPQATTFSIDQPLPLTRRLQLEKQLSAELVAAAELEVCDVSRQLIGDAQALAVQLLALKQQRALRDQQAALATKLADFIASRAKAGELSALDAAQAHLDAQCLAVESRKLEAERVVLTGKLKPLLGLNPQESLDFSGELPAMKLPAVTSWQQRADYQLALAKVRAAQTSIDLAKSKKWHDATAGIFGTHERQDSEHTGSVGIRVSVPLPWWNRNEGEIEEKSVSAQRASLEAEALGKSIAGEAEAAREEMNVHIALARDSRDKLLPLVTEQTANLEKAYESGQAELLAVLRARDQQLLIEASALDAVRDFHLARIRFETTTGQHSPVTIRTK